MAGAGCLCGGVKVGSHCDAGAYVEAGKWSRASGGPGGTATPSGGVQVAASAVCTCVEVGSHCDAVASEPGEPGNLARASWRPDASLETWREPLGDLASLETWLKPGDLASLHLARGRCEFRQNNGIGFQFSNFSTLIPQAAECALCTATPRPIRSKHSTKIAT